MAKTIAAQIASAEERARLRAARNRGAVELVRAKAIKAKAKYLEDAMANAAPFRARAGYDNARRTRLRAGARPTAGSSSSQLDRTTREKLIRECRDLYRNNSIARAIGTRVLDMIVADGAIVTSTTQNQAWNERADAMWNRWADATAPDEVGHPDVRRRMNFWRIVRGAVRAWLTDGDQLIVRTNTGSLSVVTAERIVPPGNKFAATPTMVDGVEMDANGRAIAYHVAEYQGDGANVGMKTRRIDAADCMFLVNPVHDDPDMVRGEPWLQAAIDRIEQLDRYIFNVGVAAEVSTLFGLIFKSERPKDLQDALEAATPDQETRGSNEHNSNELEIQSGFSFTCKPGESVEQVKPEQPTQSYKEYVLASLMLISAEMGLPLVLSHFDSSGLSWSNIKSLMAIMQRGFAVPHDYLSTELVRPVRSWKIRQWIDAGELDDNDEWDRCEVKWQEAPVLAFAEEAKGYAEAVQNNAMTHDQMTRALGTGRGIDVAKARSEEIKRDAELGITPAETPGAKRRTDATGEPNEGAD